MKRTVIFLFVFLLLCLPARAFGTSGEEEIAEAAGMDGLETELLTEEELNGDKGINIFNKAINIITGSFLTGTASALQTFAIVTSVLVLSSVLSAFKWTSPNQSLHTAYEYVSILALSAVVFNIFSGVFAYVRDCLSSLNLFMTAMLPVTASLMTMSGNVSAAAVSGSSMLLFFTLLEAVCARFFMPFLQISFALCLVSAIPGTVNLTSVSTLVRNTVTTAMAFVFTLFGFVLFLQTSIAGSADNYMHRSVKFASGVFIPVIGSMLGDAARTVTGSVGVIKGVAGGIGVTVLLAAVVPPFITILMYKLALLGCAVLSRVLGCDRESRFLYDLNGIMNVLFALVTGVAVVMTVFLAVFINMNVN